MFCTSHFQKTYPLSNKELNQELEIFFSIKLGCDFSVLKINFELVVEI